MAHTPGDWRLIPCDGTAYIVAPSDPRIIGDIATVHDMSGDTDGNAALIKAAPKLLAALERATLLLEEIEQTPIPVHEFRQVIAEAKRTPSREKIS